MTTTHDNYLLKLKQATDSTQMAKYLELFYNETSHLVFGYCQKRNISKFDSEDITQIVYTQIFNKRLKYNEKHSPLAWLYIITKSEAKDYLKKQKNYSTYLSDFTEFINLSQNNVESPSIEQDGNIESLTQILSESEKTAILMRYKDEKEFFEIAKDMGLTTVNVRKIISRAITKLKKQGDV